MDLVETMQKSAFLGREWLVWLWFKSELFEGPFRLDPHGEVEVWLQDQLTLEASAMELEQSQLKGPAPSTTPEAREAMRQHKLPTAARIGLRRGEQEYAFSFKADSLSLGNVSLPALVKEETDERFYERMYLLEELEVMLDALYAEFLELRLAPCWGNELLCAIRNWIYDKPSMSVDRYLELLGEVRAPKKPAPPVEDAAHA